MEGVEDEGCCTLYSFPGQRLLTSWAGTAFCRLTKLNLGKNGGQLGGQLPSELGRLTLLQTLLLDFNGFVGELPIQLGQLTALKNLNAVDNSLAGMLPTELGQLVNMTSM